MWKKPLEAKKRTYKCVNVFLLQGPVTLTFSDWASKDFRLLVTFFSSSSRSLALLWREADMCFVSMEERRMRAFVSFAHSVRVFTGFTILRALPSPQLSPALPPGSPAYEPPGTKNIKTLGQITPKMPACWSASQFKSVLLQTRSHCQSLTSSYLRSASSAMCLASFSCIS